MLGGGSIRFSAALHDNQDEVDSGSGTLPEPACLTSFSLSALAAFPLWSRGLFLALREELASQRVKDALSKWLLTFDVRNRGTS